MSHQVINQTFNKSFNTIVMGLFTMIVACFIFYYDAKSYFSYTLFAIGFFLVGIGILLGFFKLIRDDENAN